MIDTTKVVEALAVLSYCKERMEADGTYIPFTPEEMKARDEAKKTINIAAQSAIERYKSPAHNVTIRGNCGQPHNSLKEWEKCPSCANTVRASNVRRPLKTSPVEEIVRKYGIIE